MEITINFNRGTMTLREPFFPCPLRKLQRLILPLLLEDPQGEKAREEMLAFCEQMSFICEQEARATFEECQKIIDQLPEEEKVKLRTKTTREVKHMMNLSKRYKRNAEVIRG